VAAVAGNQVILNKGTGEGYRVGLRISIERTTQTVKDPQTGKVIRQITQPIGTLEIVKLMVNLASVASLPVMVLKSVI